jgi:hypothetical protein
MLEWGEQKTMRDFITVSFTRSLVPHYIGGFVTMLVLNWLWWANWGRYVSDGSPQLSGQALTALYSGASLPLPPC